MVGEEHPANKFLDEGEATVGTPEYKAGICVAAPRILIREKHRERYGHYVGDGRRSIAEIAPEFPDFDFLQVIQNDNVFYADERESDEACCDCAVKFLQWLNSRPEKCIAVVTHSSFLRHVFGQFGDTIKDDDRFDLQRMAGNCELCSVVLCSHGIKESHEITPLNPSLTIRIPDEEETSKSVP